MLINCMCVYVRVYMPACMCVCMLIAHVGGTCVQGLCSSTFMLEGLFVAIVDVCLCHSPNQLAQLLFLRMSYWLHLLQAYQQPASRPIHSG